VVTVITGATGANSKVIKHGADQNSRKALQKITELGIEHIISKVQMLKVHNNEHNM
jgi:hypothetical protein